MVCILFCGLVCDPSQHNCRKDYVRREGAIANRWENNWGFLTGQYRIVRGTLSAFIDMTLEKRSKKNKNKKSSQDLNLGWNFLRY